jgi:hypothetical protein
MVFVVSSSTFVWVLVFCLVSGFVFRDRKPHYRPSSHQVQSAAPAQGVGPVLLVFGAFVFIFGLAVYIAHYGV